MYFKSATDLNAEKLVILKKVLVSKYAKNKRPGEGTFVHAQTG